MLTIITLTVTITLTLMSAKCCPHVFRVQRIQWSDVNENPHQIVLQAAIDNSVEDETLPLSPWF